MKFSGLLSLGSLLFSLGVLAVPIADFDAKVASGLRLVQTSDDKAPFWVTEEEKLDLLRKSINFFDLTETYHLEEELKAKKVKAIVERATYPAPSRQTAVNALLPSLSTTNMNSYLQSSPHSTTVTTRPVLDSKLATTSTIHSQGGKAGVTVSKFSHSWTQQSIIAKIAGSSATAPTIILGAHEDSINLNNPTSGRAPGADDDGTGTVNVMEIFRVLVSSNFKPTRNIEFHFYSGEEAVVILISPSFKPGTTEAITLITDNTDSGLNTFVRSLVNSYSRLPVATSTNFSAVMDAQTTLRGLVKVLPPPSPSKPLFPTTTLTSTALQTQPQLADSRGVTLWNSPKLDLPSRTSLGLGVWNMPAAPRYTALEV
ncbi:peptidase M28 family [Rhizoctonia solani]|uniref:Peptide hydrolase n=1 Tax=Rhizoctonia solani TaxID=456999 RepID=A0A8H7M0R5_9AGAM|nr:peptidase M28 family [Rhizoctonia solani]